MDNEKKCGAKTRSGKPCQNHAMANGRCRLHGGKSLKGTASKTYKHGLYSKYAGDSLKEVLADLNEVDSEELIQPEQEIRLMQALIIKAKALENGLEDLKDLDTISKIIDRLITAKQRSQSIMIEQQRLIPAEDIERLLSWMEAIIIRKVGQEQGYEIMSKLKSFKLSDHAN